MTIRVEKLIWKTFKNKVVKMAGQKDEHLERAVEEALLDWLYEVKMK